LKISPGLLYKKRDLLFIILDNREGALAWDFSYLGLLKPEISLLLEIYTILYKAWQKSSFLVLRVLALVINKLV
ncbi:uncharacterized protein K444DRAFT_548612, partial [Hyaloscypha bicolor E]